jgi:hypothetical protein
MPRFVAGLFASIFVMGLVSGTAFMATHAEAAQLTEAQKAIVKHTRSQCKDQAKAKGLGWLERRLFVANCVIEGLKDHPEIDPMDLD